MYEWMKRIVKQLKILFKYFRYFFLLLSYSRSSLNSVVSRENIKIRIQEPKTKKKKKRWESLYYFLLYKGFLFFFMLSTPSVPLFATWYIPVSLYMLTWVQKDFPENKEDIHEISMLGALEKGVFICLSIWDKNERHYT